MRDTKQLLLTMGFSEAEANVYLAALKRGPSSAIELAKITSYSRQTVYEAIEGIAKHQMMSNVENGTKRYFVAEHPSKLVSYLARREHELQNLKADVTEGVRELELTMGGDRPRVHVYSGKDGVRAILDDIKNGAAKGDALEIADLDAMKRVLTADDVAPLREELKRQGITVRGLASGELGANPAQPERYKLPEYDKDFQTDIMVLGDKIGLVTFAGDMHSVLIESAPLAKTMRILFELALKTAKNDAKEK
jgi:sugar-specific transcriptional regulator TrmB